MATKKKPAPEMELVVVGTPAERAQKALSLTETKARLEGMVKDSLALTEVNNDVDRELVHSTYMAYRDTRVRIEKVGSEARSDAQEYSKAVISTERSLIAITSAEEARLKKLRDDFDAIEIAAKEARKKAEAERLAAIAGRIAAMRDAPLAMIGKPSTEIEVALAELREADDDSFEGDDLEKAQAAKRDGITQLTAMFAAAVQAEELAERLAQQMKALDEHREKLDQQEREAQAERDRLAEIERAEAAERKRVADAEADAQRAADKIEADRRQKEMDERQAKLDADERRLLDIAEANRKESKRLADEAAAREADRKATEKAEAEAAAAAAVQAEIDGMDLKTAIQNAASYLRVSSGETSLVYLGLVAAATRHFKEEF